MDNPEIDRDINANMKELATHIVSSAPIELVQTFSIDFLVKSFEEDLDAFEESWIEYQKQLHKGRKNWDALQGNKVIQFPPKGHSNVN